jgi:hypothetical protein
VRGEVIEGQGASRRCRFHLKLIKREKMTLTKAPSPIEDPLLFLLSLSSSPSES